MNNREEILTELEGISKAVAAVPYRNIFTVYDGYFTTMPQIILAKIHAEVVFNSLTDFQVPTGYFDHLSDHILKKIRLEENEAASELSSLSPLLSSIQNRKTYTVPNGYFKTLSVTKPLEETAKVISINRKGSFFKYAAAAVITGLLGLSIVNMVDNTKPQNGIQTTAEVITGSKAADVILEDKNFNEALEQVSDHEIEQYLQKNGQDVNAALVASSTDDADKLPEAEEYLIDENVLENYLKENNLNK